MTSMLDALKMLEQRTESAAADPSTTLPNPGQEAEATGSSPPMEPARFLADIEQQLEEADAYLELFENPPAAVRPSPGTDVVSDEDRSSLPILSGTALAGLGADFSSAPEVVPARPAAEDVADGIDPGDAETPAKVDPAPPHDAEPMAAGTPPTNTVLLPTIFVNSDPSTAGMPMFRKEEQATFADQLASINDDGSVTRPPPRRPTTPAASESAPADESTKTLSVEVVPTPSPQPSPSATAAAQAQPNRARPGVAVAATRPARPAGPPPLPPTAPQAAVPNATPQPIVPIAAPQPAAPTSNDPRQRARDEYCQRILTNLKNGQVISEYRALWKHLDRKGTDGNVLFLDCEEDRPAADFLVHLAAAGRDARRILLIDGDGRSPQLTKLLHYTAELGWTDGPPIDELNQLLQETGLPSTSFLPIGQQTANIDGQHAALVLDELMKMFEFVFVSGGKSDNPLLQQLHRACEESYIVIRLGTAMRQVAVDSVHAFGALGIPTKGCVVTNTPVDEPHR